MVPGSPLRCSISLATTTDATSSHCLTQGMLLVPSPFQKPQYLIITREQNSMRTNGCLEAAFKRGFRLLAVKMFPPGQLLQAPLESKWSWTALQGAAFSALIQVKSRQLAPTYPSEATLSPWVTSQWNRNPCLASEGQCRQQVMAWLQFYAIAMPEDGPWISVLFYHGFYHGEPSSVFKRARPIFILSDHSITEAV